MILEDSIPSSVSLIIFLFSFPATALHFPRQRYSIKQARAGTRNRLCTNRRSPSLALRAKWKKKKRAKAAALEFIKRRRGARNAGICRRREIQRRDIWQMPTFCGAPRASARASTLTNDGEPTPDPFSLSLALRVHLSAQTYMCMYVCLWREARR